MNALIFRGIVVQLKDIPFPVAAALQWKNITLESPRPKVGWRYDGISFSPPPPEPKPAQLTNSQIYDGTLSGHRVFKAYMLAVNTGAIRPGTNMTDAALKVAVMDLM